MSGVVEEIREECMAKGKIVGRVEEKAAIAQRMLRMGRFTLEDIAEITRLSLADVKALAAAERAAAVLAEKTATIRQLLKMGGFRTETIAKITRLDEDEVREIIARNAP